MNHATWHDGETMTNDGGQEAASEPKLLNRLLESAVVLNWKDLTNNPKALIHVEYHIGVGRSIDYLRVWCSTARGYWNLVCRCTVSPESMSELKFGDGYQSPGLGASVEAILKDQSRFPHIYAANTDHLVQVGSPNLEDTVAAKLTMEKAFRQRAVEFEQDLAGD